MTVCVLDSVNLDTVLQVETLHAVDTTGAGDCFCGALVAELDRGTDLEAAVFVANAAAALSVTRQGAAASTPSRTEVEAFLATIDPAPDHKRTII